MPSLEVLKADLQSHPALMAADANVGASLTGVELAKQQYKSDWALELGYGYRNGFQARAPILR